jgi:hypothetical protein
MFLFSSFPSLFVIHRTKGLLTKVLNIIIIISKPVERRKNKLIDTTILFGSTTLILGIIACIFTYLQLKQKNDISLASEYLKIHENIVVLGSREKTVGLLPEIVNHAQKGDIVFGHCRICTGYPEAFYRAISEAISRGVIFQAVVSKRPESEEFINRLICYDPKLFDIRIYDGDLYTSVFGIREKEVTLCYYFSNELIGIYFKDTLTTKYIESNFNAILKKSKDARKMKKKSS